MRRLIAQAYYSNAAFHEFLILQSQIVCTKLLQ